MAIKRQRLKFEDHFTQVRNEWVRDERLSRRARGLLVELMSHSPGWTVTVSSLMRVGPEGRDALRSAIAELEEHGYLARERTRNEDGKFSDVDYVTADPWGLPVSDFPTSGNPTSGNPHTKKNIYSEEQGSEEQTNAAAAARGEFLFAEFWDAYPRKVGKQAALKAWKKAVKSVTPATVLAGAIRFARDPNLPDKEFIPYPATWLNAGSWDDEPMPERKREVEPVAGFDWMNA